MILLLPFQWAAEAIMVVVTDEHLLWVAFCLARKFLLLALWFYGGGYSNKQDNWESNNKGDRRKIRNLAKDW